MIDLMEAESALASNQAAPSGKVVLLLYLNQDTFLDRGGGTATMVKRAIDLNIPVVMLHEQQADRGEFIYTHTHIYR